MKQRTLIVGDVHGCFHELVEILKMANYNPDDRLIFVGDVINKGPYSDKVLQLIEETAAECLLGNHELGFLKYLERGKKPLAPAFERVIAQLGKNLNKWVKWMSKLPLYIEEENFLVVHGGIIPDKSLEKTDASILTRVRTWDGVGVDLNNPRDPAWYDLYKGTRPIIYGHWAAEGLNVRHNTIGLDSGCVWGGKLSLLILPEKRVIQVPAKRAYCSYN